jgi:hypothetical protein
MGEHKETHEGLLTGEDRCVVPSHFVQKVHPFEIVRGQGLNSSKEKLW